ncbi:glutathione S-transferase 1-like [Ostrinia nubilalis]|uniref:glutathione S-transferase 1-like n=1 Tax=Ostrinia nubilalis TaxID=29057 RepID=UPI00308244B2
MPVTLYGTIVSPPTRATLMLLEILDITVDFKEINLPTREHYKPEYLAKNPLHTVPMIEDDGFTVVDSHAIMTYLVTKYGGANHCNMYPQELKLRTLVDQKLYFDASVLFPRVRNVIYDIALGGSNLGSPHPTQFQLKQIEEAYAFADAFLQKTKYIARDELTVADLSCVTTICSLDTIVPVDYEKYDKLYAWWDGLKKESWYQNKNVPGATLFSDFMNSLLRRR